MGIVGLFASPPTFVAPIESEKWLTLKRHKKCLLEKMLFFTFLTLVQASWKSMISQVDTGKWSKYECILLLVIRRN